jgi:glyoxylase-like metal-dependent hydrolase (beta-lactamase superfamily II)
MLLEKDGQQLLFDAGNGNEDSRLLPELQALGFTAPDIDAIFITHLHGDHIGGLVKDGQPVFPQAKLYIPSVELEAWMQDAKVQTLVAAYGASVVKFAIGDALPCGVEALAAYGHTPGHTLYRTGDKLIVGDIMHGVALQMEHPDFCARFDMDHEKAIASRKAVLEQVKKEGWVMFGMHFPTKEGVKVE